MVPIDEVKRIADLAKLNYSPDELERFVHDFQEILDYFEHLNSAPTEGIHPTYHALEEFAGTPFRADQTRPSLACTDAVSNAPQEVECQFRVPKVIE
ncbi:MAG: Asp-tRNA(Asn)/Glu-tRNA(Gln) amidotransferase subunit GatC [Acidobacteriota bacterium]